jgi:hypothetical protein
MIAIPVLHEKGLHFRDMDVSTSSVPEVEYVARSPEQEAQDIVARAKSKPRNTESKAKKGKSKTPKKQPKNTPAKPKKILTKPAPKATPSAKPKPDSVPSEARMLKQCKVPRNKAFFWSGAQTEGKK